MKLICLLLLAATCPSISEARCIGFDQGTPNFCATIEVQRKITSLFGDDCTYSGKIKTLESSIPNKQSFEDYKKIISDKPELIFHFAGKECAKAVAGENLRTVVVARCDDLKILGEDILRSIKVIAPVPNFEASENPTVQIIENAKIVSTSVTCPVLN